MYNYIIMPRKKQPLELTAPDEAPPTQDPPLTPAIEDAPSAAPEAKESMEAKPRRKTYTKKIKVTDIKQEQTKQEETKQEEPPHVENIKQEEPKKVKTLEMVECDKCSKEMTKRTLRYHHKCPGKVIKTEEQPVKKRVKKEAIKEEAVQEQTPPKAEKLHINPYQERLNKMIEQRNASLQKLASRIV